MANTLQTLQLLLPKKKAKPGGTSYTSTFRPGTPAVTTPGYKDHLNDIFSTRVADDSRALIQALARHDPDVSASIFAYSTISSSAKMVIEAYDLNGVEATDGIPMAKAVLERVFNVSDYTLGYSAKLSQEEFMDELRYMMLMRGGAGMELVLDKTLSPDQFRLVDPATLTWNETAAGVYKPFQKTAGTQGDGINLDIPTFFTTRFHQDPTDVYTYSPFISAINTIAARQQVINELYRIMQVTGYPRLDITVLEDIIMASAPPTLRQDPKARQTFVDTQISSIRNQFSNIRSDQAFVHTNAVDAKMINDKNPGAGVQISDVISVLDAQNTASLKTMPSVVGKGSNGNVASAESRLFAMNCDSLNRLIAVPIQAALTLACRLAGFQGSIKVSFTPIELRPTLELEAQLTMKQARLQTDLDLGLITDDEYHMAMYQRPRPDSAPELSGSGFKAANAAASKGGIDPADATANGDALGKDLSGEGADGVRSKTVNKGAAAKTK
jgi:hypothetical protein